MNEKAVMNPDEQQQSERTPLLQRVPVEERPRVQYPHQTVRRFCTIALITIPLLTLAIIFLCIAIAGQSDIFGDHQTEASGPQSVLTGNAADAHLPHAGWPASDGISYAELIDIIQKTPDPAKAREWSRYHTSGMHLAGRNRSQAEWTRDRWEEFGLNSSIVSYEVYLNYPLDHRLALLQDGKVEFEATLTEDCLPQDPTSGSPDGVPVFHGYSASGDVTASYVYCNYGSFDDFNELLAANISLKGKIALMRYGGLFRGLKIERASELGMAGVVIYTDPGDDGEITEEHGYKPYPEGPARNPSSVQRGSVVYLSSAPGDPTTHGYPSLPGAPRESTEGRMPDIPSTPLSYAEALPLLKALNGHGPNASSFSAKWHTGGLGYKGVAYSIGPSPDHVQLNLMNKQNYTTTPIWNVIGVINGSILDEVVVIGNHRDAWIVGGAADPNSGSATLMEIIRSFKVALDAGWKPLRTIVFASWDGEEYAILGSTEWVEEYVPWLSHATIAYLNVDTGAQGTNFEVSAAPLLHKLIVEATSLVQSPNQTLANQTVGDLWDGRIGTMGSGSDFTAFQDFVGIASLEMQFGTAPTDPVYHYHSNYDSFHWMETYGDPGFHYHVAMAKILGLLLVKLVEEPVIGFGATDYAVALTSYLNHAKEQANQTASAAHEDNLFSSLETALHSFREAAVNFDAHAAELRELVAIHTNDTETVTAADLYKSVRKANTKYKLLERQFLYSPGLDGRTWFKHVVFAPGFWTGYAGALYPGITEGLQSGNITAVRKWVDIIEARVDGAIGLLED
ncbi:hypothetical protein BAUCODRAFT_30252 [Baudoinia panamericana UAMH 10762]|uniref:Glutamate carboxypeptidase n=1 Tax=Baudoinia panamericana (strain UAMH 10762) TaxID=717646 RepID=M2NK77_BAUPA|nr:uncharacterized protein BAUCODRAFT_30252 [Baudoinia panamericana UAMH 10762]EMC99839.1 hypothetical protein BAUCODRAFT_30252 [Baudoinia panamericana UAMH 10762]